MKISLFKLVLYIHRLERSTLIKRHSIQLPLMQNIRIRHPPTRDRWRHTIDASKNINHHYKSIVIEPRIAITPPINIHYSRIPSDDRLCTRFKPASKLWNDVPDNHDENSPDDRWNIQSLCRRNSNACVLSTGIAFGGEDFGIVSRLDDVILSVVESEIVDSVVRDISEFKWRWNYAG